MSRDDGIVQSLVIVTPTVENQFERKHGNWSCMGPLQLSLIVIQGAKLG